VLIGCSLSPFSTLVYLGAIYAGLVASRGHSFSNDASGSNGRQSRVDRSGPSGPEALRKDLFFVCMVT